MAKVSRVASLDISSEGPFETREWRYERIGWATMALFVALGTLGLLGGGGPLNQVRLGSPTDPVWVEYPRIVRNQAPFDLTIYAVTEPSFIGTTTLYLNASYAENFMVESASPTVIQQQITPSGISYDFATPNDGPTTIRLRLKPTRFGIQHATLSIEGSGTQTFRQIILP